MLKLLEEKGLTFGSKTNEKALSLNDSILNLINDHLVKQQEALRSSYLTHFETTFKHIKILPTSFSSHATWLKENISDPIANGNENYLSLLKEVQNKPKESLYEPYQKIEYWLNLQADKWLKRTSFYKDYIANPISLSTWLDKQIIDKFKKENVNKKLVIIDDMFEAFNYLKSVNE